MTKITTTKLSNVLVIEYPNYSDSRGRFNEWFRSSDIKKHTGIEFIPVQANTSKSHKGVLRGIHFSKMKQAKLVTCVHGELWDFIVDLRVGSPTFLEHIFVNLTAEESKSIYIPSGFGHGFITAAEENIVTYLLDEEYSIENEREINPLDPDLKINWPLDFNFISNRDLTAPNLKDALDADLLPKYLNIN